MCDNTGALYTKAISGVLIHVVSIVMYGYWFALACGKVAHWQQSVESGAWDWEAFSLKATGRLLTQPHAVFFKAVSNWAWILKNWQTVNTAKSRQSAAHEELLYGLW